MRLGRRRDADERHHICNLHVRGIQTLAYHPLESFCEKMDVDAPR